MNKISFLIVPVILFFSIKLSFAQVKLGVKAGVNFSKVSLSSTTSGKPAVDPKAGIVLGLTADIPVRGDFYLQPTLLYADRGYKLESNYMTDVTNKFDVSASYLEIPVLVLYKPQLGGRKLLIGAGPYIGYGIGGNWKSDVGFLVGDVVTSNHGDVVFKNDSVDGAYEQYVYGKPIDYGANFTLGYEFLSHLTAQFNAQFGLANLQPKYAGVKQDGSLKNKSIGFSVGYKF